MVNTQFYQQGAIIQTNKYTFPSLTELFNQETETSPTAATPATLLSPQVRYCGHIAYVSMVPMIRKILYVLCLQ